MLRLVQYFVVPKRYTSIVASTIGADPSIPTIDPEVDVVDGALRNPEMGCCLFFLVSACDIQHRCVFIFFMLPFNTSSNRAILAAALR